MLYAIISEDVANSLPLRKQARADHLARLESLKEQGWKRSWPHTTANPQTKERNHAVRDYQ